MKKVEQGRKKEVDKKRMTKRISEKERKSGKSKKEKKENIG